MVGSSQDEAARAAVDPCASTVGDLVPDHRADEKGPNWSNLKSIADATVNRYVDYLFPHDDAQDRPCDSKWINLRPERGRVVADHGGAAEAKRCGERGGGGRGTLGRPEGHERRQGGALSAHGPRNHDAMARALLQARGRAPHRPLTIVRRPDRGRRRARASSNKARAAREGRSAPPGRTRDALPAHEIRLDSQECDSSAQKDLHHRSAIGAASAAPGPCSRSASTASATPRRSAVHRLATQGARSRRSSGVRQAPRGTRRVQRRSPTGSTRRSACSSRALLRTR